MIALHLALAVLAAQQPSDCCSNKQPSSCAPAQSAQPAQVTRIAPAARLAPVARVAPVPRVAPVAPVARVARVAPAARLAPVAQGQGMTELRWEGVKVQTANPQVKLKTKVKAAPLAVEPKVDLQVEPRIEYRFEPVQVEPFELQIEPVQVEPGRFDLRLSAPTMALRQAEPPVAVDVAPVFGMQSSQGRAWIGVELESDGEGNADLEVGRVVEGSPAERAKLQAGDRIAALDGHPIESFDQLKGELAGRHPGESVQVTIARTTGIELDRRGWGEKGKPRLGVRLSEGDGNGLLVDSVEHGWPAEAAGLRAGDRITSIQGREVGSVGDLTEVLAEIEPGDTAELEIERQLEFQLGNYPDQEGQAPAGGMQQRGQPPSEDFFAPQTREAQPPQVFGLPGAGGQQLQVQPRVPQVREREQYQPDEGGLESELRSLRDELRSLREELRALRSELDGLRRSSGRGGER
jgi:hypothetical protein